LFGGLSPPNPPCGDGTGESHAIMRSFFAKPAVLPKMGVMAQQMTFFHAFVFELSLQQ